MPVVRQRIPEERRDEPRYDGPEVVHLQGEICGANDPQLAGLRRFAQGRKYVNIDLARTSRIDPGAAAALRDTVRALSGLGKIVRLLKPNRLIGALLRALGIDAHASLIDP
ncbi:MAG TPA: hypothetical protein VNM24_17280 [Burkholderiales bacterium]|nr:hypothetical protein [Burkholderiales bacterium]